MLSAYLKLNLVTQMLIAYCVLIKVPTSSFVRSLSPIRKVNLIAYQRNLGHLVTRSWEVFGPGVVGMIDLKVGTVYVPIQR